jgi:hypothetical protein
VAGISVSKVCLGRDLQPVDGGGAQNHLRLASSFATNQRGVCLRLLPVVRNDEGRRVSWPTM